MGAQGTATLDFGTFPGKSDASVAVTGQAGIVAGSLVEAWIRPVATADHTADEHMVETLKVFAANIIAGTGFTIYGFNTSELYERPIEQLAAHQTTPIRDRLGGGPGVVGRIMGNVPVSNANKGTLIYGQWTIAWVWN